MSGSAPGAPLRAMASVTVIWIVARVISWHSPANISWPPVTSVDGRTLRHAAGPETKKLRQAALSEPVHEQKARSRPHVRYVRGSATTGAMPMQPAVSAYPSRPAPWPYPVEIRGFFLQAALRPPGTNPNEAAIAIQRFPTSSPASRNNRLAAYFWIHARQKSGAKQGFQGKSGRSAANGQYGGSQAGAILSYRLSGGCPNPPAANPAAGRPCRTAVRCGWGECRRDGFLHDGRDGAGAGRGTADARDLRAGWLCAGTE